MKKFTNAVFLSLFFIFGALFMPLRVNAGIGISPVDIDNKHLKPGNVITKEFLISRTESQNDLDFMIESDLGEMEGWFAFDPASTFTMASGQKTYNVTVTISVPLGVELKSYSGYIRIKTVLDDQAESGGVSIVEGVRIDVNLAVTEDDYFELIVRLLKIEDVPYGNPIKLQIRTENAGNTDSGPTKAALDVMNSRQESLTKLESTDIETIPYGETKDIYASFDYEGLDMGEYFGYVEVYYGEEILREERLVFRIVESVQKTVSQAEDEVLSPIEKVFKSPTLIALLGVVLLFVSVILLLLFWLKKPKGK